jgi:hypothetical protein
VATGAHVEPDFPGGSRTVREQLERVLASTGFRNSKRYPNLLRYVVEHALDESGATGLKERTLGIEVFQRPPDYDLAADPVVRISAAEIRRRLAQYYQEPGREHELRIEIPLGSYVPRFHPPTSGGRLHSSEERTSEQSIVGPDFDTEVRRPESERSPIALDEPKPLLRARRWLRWAIPLASVALSVAAVWLHPWSPRLSALDRFWSPVFNQSTPVIFCVDSPLAPDGTPVPNSRHVAFSDLVTLVRLVGVAQIRHRPYQVRIAAELTSSGLQDGSAVLVGALNNAWTERLIGSMRFGFHKEGTVWWITDRKNPADIRWRIDRGNRYADGRLTVPEDFALISHFLDARTGHVIIVAAGLTGYGTEASGRFLTDPAALESLARRAPAGWDKMNMQIVIRTPVLEGAAGPPEVVATWFW